MSSPIRRVLKVLVPGPPGPRGEAGAGAESGESTGNAVAGITLRHPTDPSKQVETWAMSTIDGGPTDYALGKLAEKGIVPGGGAGTVTSVNAKTPDGTGNVTLNAGDVGALPDDTVLPSGGDTALLTELDIWDGFQTSGEFAEWPNGTYTDYIAGIDAKLADVITAGKVTRTVIGTSLKDGLATSEDILCYTAGAARAPHALLIGGTHPSELHSHRAAMRYFTEFALSDHPVMAAMRKRMRLSLVPVLVAGRFRSYRVNANGVNINRNYPFFWDMWTNPGPSDPNYGGPAPLSENESQAIKGLLDTTSIACVVDCHTYGTSGTPSMKFSSPSPLTSGQNRLAVAAVSAWQYLYNAEANIPMSWYWSPTAYSHFDTSAGTHSNWCHKYLQHHLGRPNASALLIECLEQMYNTLGSRPAMKIYCGMIHCYLVMWLANGQQGEPSRPAEVVFARNVVESGTSIASGGSLIDTTVRTPVSFNDYVSAGATRRSFIDIALREPGYFVLEAQVVLESLAANTNLSQIEIAFGWGKTPVSGGNVSAIAGAGDVALVDVPAGSGTAGRAVTATLRRRIESGLSVTDDNPMWRAQLYVRRTASTENVVLRSARLSVVQYPSSDSAALPIRLRSS